MSLFRYFTNSKARCYPKIYSICPIASPRHPSTHPLNRRSGSLNYYLNQGLDFDLDQGLDSNLRRIAVYCQVKIERYVDRGGEVRGAARNLPKGEGWGEFPVDKLGIKEVYNREPDDDSCHDVKKKGGNSQEVNTFIIMFA
jgi:hypothetical protein